MIHEQSIVGLVTQLGQNLGPKAAWNSYEHRCTSKFYSL